MAGQESVDDGFNDTITTSTLGNLEVKDAHGTKYRKFGVPVGITRVSVTTNKNWSPRRYGSQFTIKNGQFHQAIHRLHEDS